MIDVTGPKLGDGERVLGPRPNGASGEKLGEKRARAERQSLAPSDLHPAWPPNSSEPSVSCLKASQFARHFQPTVDRTLAKGNWRGKA